MPAQNERVQSIANAVAAGSRQDATVLAIAALEDGFEHPLIFRLVADRMVELGRTPQAILLLEEAVEDGWQDDGLLRRLGTLNLSLGRLESAKLAFEQAVKGAGRADYDDLMTIGSICYRMGDLPTSERFFERAVDLTPSSANALSALALVAARTGAPSRARDLASAALVLDPASIEAQLALTHADAVDQKFLQVEQRATDLLNRRPLIEATHQIAALDLRADACDKLDRPDIAFADYTQRNDVIAESSRASGSEAAADDFIDRVRRISSEAPLTAKAWRTQAADTAPLHRPCAGHIFMLGFPRSGTTLLEKVLSGHPRVATLEEVDVLSAIGGSLVAGTQTVEAISQFTREEIESRRQDYWNSIQGIFKRKLGDKVILDKLPLHTLSIPLIKRLFPDANIIFSLRDPRDIILSCFRRRFMLNAAMLQFLSLRRLLEFYHLTMVFALTYLDEMPNAVHYVKHEELVADFQREIGDVLRFTGLDWDDALHSFAARAALRSRTPSDPQLALGLNSQGVGQWRRYEAQLAPVMDGLAVWVEKFGYPAV